jgi:hypothetical protein
MMGFFSRFRKKDEDDDPMRWTEVRKQHYTKFLGPIDKVVHPSIDLVTPHIDVYPIPPHGSRNYWTLITEGMSNYKQDIPDDATAISGRTEIMMYVHEPKQWMYSVLIGLGKMPFEDKTFLHWYHTVPNGQPMTSEPSELTSFFFLPPYFENEGFDSLKIEGDKVDILWLVPITEREREYAMKNGGRALEEVFVKAELDPVFDEKRKSLA